MAPHRPNIAYPPIALILALMLSCACAGTGSQRYRDPDFDFDALRTYAWKEKPRLLAEATDEDGFVIERLERTVERELGGRGMTRTPKDEAQVVVSATLRVDSTFIENDPRFALYVQEEQEQGTLLIEVFDRLARKSVWRGERSVRLRTIGRTMGNLVPRFEQVDEPRDWNVRELARAVIADLPGPPSTGATPSPTPGGR